MFCELRDVSWVREREQRVEAAWMKLFHQIGNKRQSSWKINFKPCFALPRVGSWKCSEKEKESKSYIYFWIILWLCDCFFKFSVLVLFLSLRLPLQVNVLCRESPFVRGTGLPIFFFVEICYACYFCRTPSKHSFKFLFCFGSYKNRSHSNSHSAIQKP